jgi:integrase
MVSLGWVRKSINTHLSRIKAVFKWAGEQGLVKPTVYHGLLCVSGLRAGRSQAKESEPVRPVPEALVKAIRPFVSRQVNALIDLQLLSGMRPGEACLMRACDLDMTGRVWVYTPESHKTAHHGHRREIYLGPRAQGVIKPFLRTELAAYLFSPQHAREERFETMRAKRKTKVQPSQACRRRRKPKKLPGDRYDAGSYRQAIVRATRQAFPLPEHLAPRMKAHGKRESKREWRVRLSDDEKREIRDWHRQHSWHPHQLRHNAATVLRKEHGIELARIILGHKTVLPTQLYAEADRQQAVEVIGKIG